MPEVDTVYALIENGVVVNTIVWDGNTADWTPPAGQIAVLVRPEDGSVSIGWLYDGSHFSDPNASAS